MYENCYNVFSAFGLCRAYWAVYVGRPSPCLYIYVLIALRLLLAVHFSQSKSNMVSAA
jgi:hypothetical protein